MTTLRSTLFLAALFLFLVGVTSSAKLLQPNLYATSCEKGKVLSKCPHLNGQKFTFCCREGLICDLRGNWGCWPKK